MHFRNLAVLLLVPLPLLRAGVGQPCCCGCLCLHRPPSHCFRCRWVFAGCCSSWFFCSSWLVGGSLLQQLGFPQRLVGGRSVILEQLVRGRAYCGSLAAQGFKPEAWSDVSMSDQDRFRSSLSDTLRGRRTQPNVSSACAAGRNMHVELYMHWRCLFESQGPTVCRRTSWMLNLSALAG